MPSPDEIKNDIGDDTERLVFFSDAVFAIALTLLVIDLRVPEIEDVATLPAVLQSLWPNLLGLLISFITINLYWRLHHRMFRVITRYNKRLLGLNTLFLLTITLQPFTTSLVARYGNQPVAMMLYAALFTATAATTTGIWIYATHNHRLIPADIEPRFIRSQTLEGLAGMLFFLVSIVLPLVIPPRWVPWVPLFWTLNWPAGVIIERSNRPMAVQRRPTTDDRRPTEN